MDYLEFDKGWKFVDENGEEDFRIQDIMQNFDLSYDDSAPIDVSEFNCKLVGDVYAKNSFEIEATIKTSTVETIARIGGFSEYYEVTTKSGGKYRLRPDWIYTQIFGYRESMNK